MLDSDSNLLFNDADIWWVLNMIMIGWVVGWWNRWLTDDYLPIPPLQLQNRICMETLFQNSEYLVTYYTVSCFLKFWLLFHLRVLRLWLTVTGIYRVYTASLCLSRTSSSDKWWGRLCEPPSSCEPWNYQPLYAGCWAGCCGDWNDQDPRHREPTVLQTWTQL